MALESGGPGPPIPGAGTRTFLGGTPNDAYFVPSVAKAAGEAVTLEALAVSEAFAASPGAQVVVT